MLTRRRQIRPPEANSPVERRGGVTRRAVFVALLLLLLLGFLNFYIDMVWGTRASGGWAFSSGAPSVVPLSTLFLLTLLMALAWLRRRGLSRRDGRPGCWPREAGSAVAASASPSPGGDTGVQHGRWFHGV
jgi:hypothetical protein